MKIRTRLLVFIATALFVATLLPAPRADLDLNQVDVALSQHGTWYVSTSYGRVWQPREYTPQWNPYYDGHWVNSDLGWVWVSDYTWGDVAYHYGTWALDPVYGWVWVPGVVWAPAWVVFRTGPGYVGWAPVSPGFSIGMSGTVSDIAPTHYVFVSDNDFLAPRIRSRVVTESVTRRVYTQTRVINTLRIENNIVVNRGLDASPFARTSGGKIEPVPIESVSRAAPGPKFSRELIVIEPARAGNSVQATQRMPEPRVPPGQQKKQEKQDKHENKGNPK